MVKCIIILFMFALSSAIGLRSIKVNVQYQKASTSDKEKVLAHLQRGRINRSKTGLLFHQILTRYWIFLDLTQYPSILNIRILKSLCLFYFVPYSLQAIVLYLMQFLNVKKVFWMFNLDRHRIPMIQRKYKNKMTTKIVKKSTN